MKITRSTFTCTRDGLTLRGTQFLPEGEHLPIAIISHGFMANQQSVVKYARQFAKWGYASYCFDFNGGCIKGKSDGKTTDMSVLTEKEDLKAVISYVKGLPFVNPDRLILMGCSQGGFVSALAAAELKSQVSRLILFYPAFCIPDDARRGQMMMASFDPDEIPDIIRCGPMQLGRTYPASVRDMDPFQEISAYHGPVLIVHGTEDHVVKLSYAQKAWESYTRKGKSAPDPAGDTASETTGFIPSAKCQLLVLEGAGHGFSARGDAAALFGVKQFLRGRTEILTIDVKISGRVVTRKGYYSQVVLPFEGKAKGPYFTGTILPGAADVQDRRGNQPVKFCADYTLKGRDYTGKECKIRILNTYNGRCWMPAVTTDSKALSFLNSTVCDAVLENRKTGPIVRIYAKVHKT